MMPCQRHLGSLEIRFKVLGTIFAREVNLCDKVFYGALEKPMLILKTCFGETDVRYRIFYERGGAQRAYSSW